MKKIFALLLCICLVLSFAGCKNENTENGKLNIVATIFPAFDFARQIAGDTAKVDMLLPPSSESHFYEPSLSDIAKIEQCDLFIYAGGEIDKWADNVLKAIGKDIKVICMSSVTERLHESHPHEHNDNGGFDSHVWTSPKNAKLICEEITATLCALKVESKEFYQKSLLEYSAKLDLLDNSLREIAQNKKRDTLIFADRFPFLYLTEEYGFNVLAAIDGCSSETEPTLSAISNIIDTVNSEDIPVVFYIEFSSQKTADSVCDKTSAKKLLLHSCHNVSQAELDNGEDYISLMTKNIQNIKEALY